MSFTTTAVTRIRLFFFRRTRFHMKNTSKLCGKSSLTIATFPLIFFLLRVLFFLFFLFFKQLIPILICLCVTRRGPMSYTITCRTLDNRFCPTHTALLLQIVILLLVGQQRTAPNKMASLATLRALICRPPQLFR